MPLFFRAVKLRTKLVLSYLIIFILAIMVFSAYVQYVSVGFIRENNISNISGMVDKSAAQLSLKMEQINSALELCAFQEELQKVYYNRIHSQYDLYVKLSNLVDPFFLAVGGTIGNEVESIYMYSETGLSTYSHSIVNAVNVRSEEWYQTALSENGINWKIMGNTVVVTLRVDPITNLFGKNTLGLVCIRLKADKFLSNYANPDTAGGRMEIYDRNDNLIYTYGETAGEDTVIIEKTISPAHWRIKYIQNVPAAQDASEKVVKGLGLVIVLSAATMAVIIAVFSRFILKGMTELKKGMKRVRGGDLSVRMKVKTRDEIGMLTIDFNNMLETIEGYIGEIRENERKLSGLEYRSLRNQIDPHFLYNTLSFIRWKCMRAGMEDARIAVEKLSMFYRTCLNKGGDFTVVENEMNNIRAYADIQQLLHDNSFDIVYDVPEALYRRSIPCFIVQPLVENAILHGVDERKEGRGRIVIRLAEKEQTLEFTVTDNGPGIPEGTDHGTLIDSPESVGISNVNERIRLLVGKEYGYSIRNIEGGCEAKLTLPLGKE